jgi:putative acetyltransferase
MNMESRSKVMIREASASDLSDVLYVEREAFGSVEVPNLVRDLLEDSSARPLLSMLAFEGDQAVGHILFTKAILDTDDSLSISILAPLAVVPSRQKQGIGGKLIETGLKILKASGVELVFVLGHPEYYPRHGFSPAGIRGLHAPYPIPEKNAGAWMVQELRSGIIDRVKGAIMCADKMNEPQHWRE